MCVLIVVVVYVMLNYIIYFLLRFFGVFSKNSLKKLIYIELFGIYCVIGISLWCKLVVFAVCFKSYR